MLRPHLNAREQGALTAFALLLFFIAYCPVAFAGAWTQKRGDLFVSQSASVYYSDHYFDSQRKRQEQLPFYKAEKNLYAEYGWNDDLTIGANLFLHYIQQEQATSITTSSGAIYTQHYSIDNIGLGDPELFFRHNIWRTEQSVLSIQPLLKLPSYYQQDRRPKAGSDSLDGEISLQFGHSFEYEQQWHYLDVRLGYRYRTNRLLHDQLKLDAQLGYTVAPNWRIIPSIAMTFATDTPRHPVFTEDGQNDYDLIKCEISTRYQYSPTRTFFVNLFQHVAGRNAGGGHGLTIGTALEL